MATQKQVQAAKQNIAKAQQGARSKRTLANLPAETRRDMGRQAARLVDKILRGTKPAQIPVEVSPKVEFVINLKVAKAMGLTIAPEVLYRADRLIR